MKMISRDPNRFQQTSPFQIELNDDNQIVSLKNSADPHQMNWVKPNSEWGKVKTTKALTVDVTRHITANGELVESYKFTNKTAFEIDTLDTQLGLYLPFPDYYTDAAVSLTQCCHAHIWCGDNSSYVMGLRMGGEAPNLGLVLTKGRFQGYSVERSYDFDNHQENVSNDRGKFIFHPENLHLRPGESYTLEWQLFWFNNKQDFKQRLHQTPGFISVQSRAFVVLKGEPIQFSVHVGGDQFAAASLRVTRDGQPLHSRQTGRTVTFEEIADQAGDYQYEIQQGHRRTKAVFHVVADLATLAARRTQFIATHQQRHDPHSHLNGAYLIFDNEDQTQYYDHLNDHNGGRERVGMAVLMARYLRQYPKKALRESLDHYLEYLFRELFDEQTGTVFNDVSRNNDDPRLYNYPWVGQLLLEMYHLDGEKRYLTDYLRLITHFYENGGSRFYAIGLPMLESIQLFKRAGLTGDAALLTALYRQHVETLIRINQNYPRSEVAYEQAIVAPAVIYMAEFYLISGEDRYKRAALAHLSDLALFQGFQPDFHLNETPIRHWDGYWFGKRRLLGDTFPHYWTALSGIAYLLAYRLTENQTYRAIAKKSLRSPLSLFMDDGTASCAFLYPMSINDQKGKFFDPWANDQDWGLYYALKYENFVKD